MSIFAVSTFDLHDASAANYEDAYRVLSELGLERTIIASSGNEIELPNTTVVGEFEGQSATELRDNMRERVRRAFNSEGLNSTIFVVTSRNWAWGSTNTN